MTPPAVQPEPERDDPAPRAEPVMLRTCWYCFRRYEANSPVQKYCCVTHKRRWKQQRLPWAPCPHPYKIGFNDLDVALTAARTYDKQHPYMCVCGGWHLATTRP